jgi:hypothetical protein
MINKKSVCCILVSVLLLFSLQAYSETKKLREVGQFRFMDADKPAEELMASMMSQYAEDINVGFALAGYGELFTPFMEQVRQANYEERSLAVGDVMKWMVFRSQGKVKMVQDLEWAGTEPLPVYSFTFVHGDNLYEVVIPKACGNITLFKVEPAPTQSRMEPVEEEEEPEYEIRRAKIYDEIYALLSDSDLYCSFRIHSGDDPEMTIIGAEREDERQIYSDGDVVYVNKGRVDGLESGQVFMVLEIPKHHRVLEEARSVYRFGDLAFKRGRARILDIGETKSTAVLEKSCDAVVLGSFLVPFEPQESLMGKDLGFDVPPFKADGVSGEVVYLQTDYNQVGSGHWALIDLGAVDGMNRGQQLIIYREMYEGAPLMLFGNVVVVDVQEETSTVKVLSCRDAIRPGDYIMTRPSR